MKKLLFIDRDGTIITEPADEQIDSFEKLEFYPYAISNLSRIAQLDFSLIMVTNQDGLGTASFPENTFWPVQDKILAILAGEGIKFDDIHIDRSFPEENLPTRKPGTAMLTQYLTADYDIKNSYVIGDRLTDIELAHNLGCKGILLQPEDKGEEMLEGKEYNPACVLITDKWIDIYTFLRHGERTAVIERKTSETDISIFLDLDGGKDDITTGLHFFDHMLQQLVHHAGVGLEIEVLGDLHVDEHHTIEDTAIALGEAFYKALGSKRGIERYGYALPMDECNALVLLDFGGRIDFDWQVDFTRERIGDVPTEMFKHFFKSFAESARCNLHIKATGENEHHKIEGVFKAFARAIKMAIRRNAFSNDVPSSKGIL